jgi:hypothetical protein
MWYKFHQNRLSQSGELSDFLKMFLKQLFPLEKIPVFKFHLLIPVQIKPSPLYNLQPAEISFISIEKPYLS